MQGRKSSVKECVLATVHDRYTHNQNNVVFPRSSRIPEKVKLPRVLWLGEPFLFPMSVENNKEPTRDQTTQDFLTGLKEREELKSKLHEKERECNTLKGIVYDMTKKIENLEKQVSYSKRFDVQLFL